MEYFIERDETEGNTSWIVSRGETNMEYFIVRDETEGNTSWRLVEVKKIWNIV